MLKKCIDYLQDVGGTAKEFGHLSGKYTMDLVIGDAVIQNPLSWTVVSNSLRMSSVRTDNCRKCMTV